MNFETKYLIRWGIPGWIMVMVLLPYYIVAYYDFLNDTLLSSITDILALGAVLTVLGVPLGYLLNQIHHSIFWVCHRKKNDGWDKYFKEEIDIDEYFDKDEKFQAKRDRYRYLLSKKHEVGGVSISLILSGSVIVLTNLFGNNHLWSWIYFIVVLILSILFWQNRNYSNKNIDKYHDYYLRKSREGGTSN